VGLADRLRHGVAIGAAGLLAASCALSLVPSPSPTPGQVTSPPPTPEATLASPSPTPSPTVATPGPSTPSTQLPPVPSATPFLYVVQPGDTLSAIARRFSTTVDAIGTWNAGRYPSLDPSRPTYDPNRIGVGWVLWIAPGMTAEETGPPSPSVGPSPSGASPVIPPTATPAPGAALLVSHGARGGNAVALTFDMGGRLDPARQIVGWLVEHRVPATIFPTGKTGTQTEIGRAVLVEVAAHPDLFVLGNHTWDHPDLVGLSPAAVRDQLTRTEAAIVALVGRSTKPFFRPPYGRQDATVRAAAAAAGWTYTVLWDVDTVDWKPPEEGGPSTDDIVARVLSRVQGGSIVLFHLGGYHTGDALPMVVDGLRARGLVPVTLATLLGTT
jgi:peptidoglycan/xylan/chitin deacetylase (PgdA/CDA1 family)